MHQDQNHFRFEISDQGWHQVLNYLSINSDHEVIASDIAHGLGVTSARIAVLLHKLETQNLISRTSCADDGRKSVISLTPKGEHILASIRASMVRQMEQLLDDVGLDNLRLYFSILKQINESFQRQLQGSYSCPSEKRLD